MITVKIIAGDYAGQVVYRDKLEDAKSLVIEHFQAGGKAYIEHSPGTLIPIRFLSYDPMDKSWVSSDIPPEM